MLELELELEAGKGLEPGLGPRAPRALAREPQRALGADGCWTRLRVSSGAAAAAASAAASWSCHSNHRCGWRMGVLFFVMESVDVNN